MLFTTDVTRMWADAQRDGRPAESAGVHAVQ